jgi:hypothetical protein
MEIKMAEEETTTTESTDTTETTTESKQESNWYDSIDADTRGYWENKGWFKPGESTPEQVLLENAKAYRELEKFKGASEKDLLKLPKEGDTDAWSKVYERLGRPESADKYELPEVGAGQTLNEDAAKWYKETAFELGLNSNQAKAMFEKYAAFEGEIQKAAIEGAKAQFDEELLEVKKDWGHQYDERKELALRAAKTAGLTENDINLMGSAIGTGKAYNLLAKLGDTFSEDKRVDGESQAGFGMSPDAAKNKLTEFTAADIMKITTNKNSKEFKEWQRLNDIAYGVEVKTAVSS